ncbi:DALR anticodon-binding domain-containing protein [Planomonospora corallina]|uniref:DALR anticodon-binding domain-containing protein n=1 Tax=Planomonospora corallina TaxID=1806052 RepID=A0ABV8HZT1_9ACTN
MTPRGLAEVLGTPPAPRGTWEHEALYVSTAALRRGEPPQELAERVRALPGIAEVRLRPGAFLEIVVAVPGELVEDVGAVPPPLPPASPASPVGAAPAGPSASPASSGSPISSASPVSAGRGEKAGPRWAAGPASPWRPGTWDNPGFAVGYAHARAVAVARWAAELGVAGEFRPELLACRRDRAVLRALAEAPGRRVSRDPGWAAYAERLALVYHDAFERAPALPKGDEEPSALHVARVRLAGAVRQVLAEALVAIGLIPPDRL